jgi:hypothetical protein
MELMFHHMVMFRFKTGTTQDQIDAIAEGLATLPGQIKVLASYSFGPDAGITEGAWDYGISAKFANEADYAIYATDPAHTEVVRMIITPVVDEIARVQLRS